MKILYSQQITKILEQTENSLKKIFKERLNKLILYGSYARVIMIPVLISISLWFYATRITLIKYKKII